MSILTSSVAQRNVAETDPGTTDIVFIEGDVCDPSVVDLVIDELPDLHRCMVVEDSAHVYETTLAALKLYARFVPLGGYFVVEDGCVDVEEMRLSPTWPRGVLPALDYWLSSLQGSEFVSRRDLELYGLTCHPRGFLERIRPEIG